MHEVAERMDWRGLSILGLDPGSLILLMSIFGTIPVAGVLLYKGAQLGTILAFIMASLR